MGGFVQRVSCPKGLRHPQLAHGWTAPPPSVSLYSEQYRYNTLNKKIRVFRGNIGNSRCQSKEFLDTFHYLSIR